MIWSVDLQVQDSSAAHRTRARAGSVICLPRHPAPGFVVWRSLLEVDDQDLVRAFGFVMCQGHKAVHSDHFGHLFEPSAREAAFERTSLACDVYQYEHQDGDYMHSLSRRPVTARPKPV
jgi:hypothetical protein